MVYSVMNRAQILLEEWQYDTLKALSERRGESLSHVVREAVAMYLSAKDQPARPRLAQIEGLGSDRQATGRAHDQFLYAPRPRAAHKRRARPRR